MVLAHKLTIYYACELICLQSIVGVLPNQKEGDLERLSKHCRKFLTNSFGIICFLRGRMETLGFEEFKFEEFNPFKSGDLPKIVKNILREKLIAERPQKSHILLHQPSASLEFRSLSEV